MEASRRLTPWHLTDVSAQLHAAALLPAGNNPGTDLTGRRVSPTAGLGVLLLPGSESRTKQPVAQSL
jgi:hypothetical protein